MGVYAKSVPCACFFGSGRRGRLSSPRTRSWGAAAEAAGHTRRRRANREDTAAGAAPHACGGWGWERGQVFGFMILRVLARTNLVLRVSLFFCGLDSSVGSCAPPLCFPDAGPLMHSPMGAARVLLCWLGASGLLTNFAPTHVHADFVAPSGGRARTVLLSSPSLSLALGYLCSTVVPPRGCGGAA
jgi:hypothetical protein